MRAGWKAYKVHKCDGSGKVDHAFVESIMRRDL